MTGVLATCHKHIRKDLYIYSSNPYGQEGQPNCKLQWLIFWITIIWKGTTEGSTIGSSNQATKCAAQPARSLDARDWAPVGGIDSGSRVYA